MNQFRRNEPQCNFSKTYAKFITVIILFGVLLNIALRRVTHTSKKTIDVENAHTDTHPNKWKATSIHHIYVYIEVSLHCCLCFCFGTLYEHEHHYICISAVGCCHCRCRCCFSNIYIYVPHSISVSFNTCFAFLSVNRGDIVL